MTIADKVYELLPEDGSKLSGGIIREQLGIGKVEFNKAKDELRASQKIICGRGRGGTVCRNLTESEHIEKPKKLTKQELAENARQVKQVRKADERRRLELENKALEIGKREHPEASRIEVQVWNLETGEVYVYPFYNSIAHTHRVFIN